MRRFIFLVGIIIVSACSSTPTPELENIPVVNDKPARVNRNLSLSWAEENRAGSAMRQPAYIHTLGGGILEKEQPRDDNKKTASNNMLHNDYAKTIEALNSIKKGKGYSAYELSRWERYCDEGRGMDERDWQFISSEGVDNLPTGIITHCSAPKYNYTDYLAAWSSFCTDKAKIISLHRSIVKNSVRPFSAVNPCSSLKGMIP